ncbi:ATP-dependent nuclease [Flavobacterium beibuense]|uniref:ATP-dependent endonuclease of the OLD family-like protein n=1 Tax=Flavobacterium beibuense TaxID=657326 RepID=A0A444WF77_9FLAO|nr:AAA family ATPase [Flavobacterium beibuense]RYJ44511.1 ATP-dependent endonuclease of the OLD family-like protein [Flavobacterium beibuense]
MRLVKVSIGNLKGIEGIVTLNFNDFNVIVGQNDAGKSTILKALDLFLNDNSPKLEDLNNKAESKIISVELSFKSENVQIIIDESVETTFEIEEILSHENLLVIKKEWDVSKSRVSSEVSIIRKKYDDNDCLLLTEPQLIALCGKHQINTQKANNEEFNNPEKRQKIRDFNHANHIGYGYLYENIPSAGKGRIRTIYEEIKKVLPAFEYFKADTSLSENETAIQNFFKRISYKTISQEIDISDVERHVTNKLSEILENITDKINRVVDVEEEVKASISFDWTKLISTSFKSLNDGVDIPLSGRGDGFRRITMMAYFEYLAEQDKSDKQNIIFGFEEPETFLHPSAQEKLFNKLKNMLENGYQIAVSTHSPIIVAKTEKNDIIHIKKTKHGYIAEQNIEDILPIANDLGISVDNQFVSLFDKAKALLLVEGIDDANAFHHIAKEYKANGLIDADFNDLEIAIIPVGGCDSIKHWVTLDLLNKLGKPFYIFQDSDKNNASQISPNYTKLITAGFRDEIDFRISKKRSIENYIPFSKLNSLVPGADLNYGDWDNVKQICIQNPHSIRLGGKKVCGIFFDRLTFAEIRSTFFDGTEDEFMLVYQSLKALIPN